MKKLSLLSSFVLFMLLTNNGFAQIFNYNFDNYQTGSKVAQTIGNEWTTWYQQPGSGEDAVISDENASSTPNAVKFVYGNDQILRLGNYTSTTFNLKFDMFVPEGKSANINFLHTFAGDNSEYGAAIYFNHDEYGTAVWTCSGGQTIAAPTNAWFAVEFVINLDDDNITMKINNNIVLSWRYSLQAISPVWGECQLAAINFCPPQETSEFYIDNVCFAQSNASQFSVNPESIEENLSGSQTASYDIAVSNSGSATGKYITYVNFGQGEESSDRQEFGVCGSPYFINGLNQEWRMELGSIFRPSQYGGSVMGTKIVKAEYFICRDNYGSSGICSDLVFRVYRQGYDDFNPGEVLAQKTLPLSQMEYDTWNSVEFDVPVALNGFDVWVTVEFNQDGCGKSIYTDGAAEHTPGCDMLRRDQMEWCSINNEFGVALGNLEIKMVCEGEPVAGSWASLDKKSGEITSGSSDNVVLTLNCNELPDAQYVANVVILTNEASNPAIMIPVTLNVGTTSVEECAGDNADVYPNPVANTLYINVENVAYVSIYNPAGQLLDIVRPDSGSVDMSKYESGVFLVNIVDNQSNSIVRKIVKK